MKNHVTGKSIATLPCPYCKQEAAVPTKLVASSVFDTTDEQSTNVKSFKLTGEQENWNDNEYPYIICKCECLNCDTLSYAKIAVSVNIEDAITGKSYSPILYEED